MKLKQSLPLLTGALLLGLSFQGLAQNPGNQDRSRMLEEKKQEIERLAKENEELKQQIDERESAIADFKSRIKSLDEKIQQNKDSQGAATGKDNG